MSDRRKYADRRLELIKAVAKRRRKIKTLAIEYKVANVSFAVT